MHFGPHSQLRQIYCPKEQVTLAHWSHSYWYSPLALSFVSFWDIRTSPTKGTSFHFSGSAEPHLPELFERASPIRSSTLSSFCLLAPWEKPALSAFPGRTTLL